MTGIKEQNNEQAGGISRREFLRRSRGGMAAFALAATVGVAAFKSRNDSYVWQLDPEKCIQCGRCETECVLTPSAVKSVHTYDLCGYCKLCGGYHHPQAKNIDTAAENQLCPTGAIQRSFVEEPFYEYKVIEELCIGCGKCVKGCSLFGNGSLFLQVRHDRCVNCNQCKIARACPARAFRRVPTASPYILKEA